MASPRAACGCSIASRPSGAVALALQEARGGARIPRLQAATDARPARRSAITVFPNDRAAARALAQRIAGALAAKPRLVLGLPTGRTPVGFYHELASLRRARARRLLAGHDVQPRRVPRHPADRIPAATGSSWSDHLFSRVEPRSASRSNFLDGAARGSGRGVRALRGRRSPTAGGIDLQILGIGTNGHIGFNEPARELQARTHRVTLKPETRRSNAALFGGDPDAVPARSAVDGDGDDPAGARRSCCSRRDDRRRRASSGSSTGRSRPSCRRRSCSCITTSTSCWTRRRRELSSSLSRDVGAEQLAQPRLDVLADRLAHRVVGLLQPLAAPAAASGPPSA